MIITNVLARQILDSRGNPTVEVEIYSGKLMAKAAVPSGASTGKYEAVELRDNGKEFHGKGVMIAVNNVNNIIKKSILKKDFNQKKLDEALIKLDGTPNKAKLGANAILAVSMAFARLAALKSKKELFQYLAGISGVKNSRMPVPFCNVINGGRHAGGALKMQEFMIVPIKFSTFNQAVRASSEVYHELKKILEEKFGKSSVNVGDEGGFAPPIAKAEEALDMMLIAIKNSGYEGKVMIAMDPAASEFYKDGKYSLDKTYSKTELIDYYLKLINKYPIISLEDPFDQDDFESWTTLLSKVKIPIVGDDLLVTNVERIKIANEKKLCNSLLLKVNQIGTVTEAINAAKMSMNNGWKVMVSHRSGETEDSFIADLSVGLGCGAIKIGAPCRSERVCKYNQLLRIEEKGLKYDGW